MKTRIFTLALILCVAGLATACKEDDAELAPVCDCFVAPFIDNFSTNYQNAETYFIKGIALDVIDGYGRKIKLLEDMKGNFTRNINETFTIWGALVCRIDNLAGYDYQDTLLMLLNSAQEYKFKITDKGKIYHERVGDYITLGCYFSVLKISNGNVMGHILPYVEGQDTPFNIMPCEELSMILNNEVKLCD